MGLLTKAWNISVIQRPTVSIVPAGGTTSLLGGQQQYQQLARTAGNNELIYAAIELIATSAAEPHIIGHRWRRNSPKLAPREAIQRERRNQVLDGRFNRANSMQADRWMLRNGYIEETPAHPLIRILNNPNPFMSRGQLWGSVVRDLLIAADAFVYKARYNGGLLDGAVGELWRLRPDRVKPVTGGARNELVGYSYTVDGTTIFLPIDDVMHFKKGQNPVNDFLGWSPLMTLLERSRIDAYQRGFLAAFYETGGTGPGAVLAVKGRMEQKDKDEIRERNRRQFGPGNFLEMMIIDQSDGVTYQPLSLNRGLRDALPLDINSITETRIASVFGIPGSILGLLVAYANGAYASRKQDWQTLWDITMTPTLSDLDDVLNLSLVPEFAGIDEVCFDLSDIRALQEDEDALQERARKNVAARIWTLEEGRTHTGMGEAEVDDHYLLPDGTAVKVGELDNQPEEPAPAQLMARAVALMLPEGRVGRPPLEEDEDARELARQMKEFRAEHPGVTISQLATRFSVSESTVKRYRRLTEADEE